MSMLVQPVIGDSGSQEVELIRAQLNLATNALLSIQSAVNTSTDYASLKTAVVAVDLTTLRQITLTRQLPPYRRFPTHA